MTKNEVILISRFFFLLLFSGCSLGDSESSVVIISPDQNTKLTVLPQPQRSDSGGFGFSVQYKDRHVILPSTIRVVSEEIDFGGPWSISKVEKTTVDSEWSTRFSERSRIPDKYNQTKIYLKSSTARLNLICRAYHEGVAFAYEVPEQGDHTTIHINQETIDYRFAEDHFVWSTPKRQPRVLTAQGQYRRIPLSEIQVGCERPLVVEVADDLKIALAEAKLVDYARLSFNASPQGQFGVRSSLDGRVTDVKQNEISGALESDRSKDAKVVKKLPFTSPWRVVMMAEDYGKLLENNYLILNLNEPSEIADESWIKPGKVLRETTLTTEGGLAAIDFVAAHNMQYVHFDAGWYGNEMDDRSDATTITLDPKRSSGPFDLNAICRYAREKGIGVMLYVNRRALEKQLDQILPLYESWGIAGIKYGFVRVGDQDATAWLHEAVKKTAQHRMIIDVHDEYRPIGFSRTYPNLLTQEGIRGDEETVPNEHTLITMFTRMLAGAGDNTVCYYNKRVDRMGSHASQLAKTVCLFSPLQFLYWYDKPASSPEKLDGLWGDTKHIGDEPELFFFDAVPTTWDETKVLVAEIGEIGVIARRKGADWFVGGINGPAARTVELDFSFLAEGVEYKAMLYTDDPAVKTRTHVKIKEMTVNKKSDSLKLEIQSNNGFAMQLTATLK